MLEFIGFTDIRLIVVEPTLADKESAERSIAAAEDSARALAKVLRAGIMAGQRRKP